MIDPTDNHHARECFVLHLAPVPDPVLRRTPEARLRALLKCSLRAYGLRATILKPTTTTDTEEQP